VLKYLKMCNVQYHSTTQSTSPNAVVETSDLETIWDLLDNWK